MSLLDDVSIVVTPNGYKSGELYAVVPVPTEGAEEVTNGDFATDSDWTKGTGWTISGGAANASATTATLVHIGSLGTVANVRYLISMDVTVISGTVRVRNSSGWVETEISSSNTYNYYAILGSSSSLVIEGISSFTGSINSISIKEYTSADMDVTRATDATRVDENGLIEDVLSNVPRIDYTGGGCPHILAEPQRTNLVTYSSDFSNAVWGNASIGTTPVLTSGFTSPDGTDNAYKISNANQDSFLYISGITAATDSRSIYARTVSGTGTAQLLSHNSNTNNTFNLTEEWQRFEVSATTSGTGPTSYYAVDFRGSGTLTELLIWGAQTEVGSYPTSYIPTSGSTVTRNQDQFTRDGIGSLINSTEGVLFVEMAALSDDGTLRQLSLSGGGANTVRLILSSSANSVRLFIQVGGGTAIDLTYTLSDTTSFFKAAIRYANNNFSLWVNGVKVKEQLSGTIFSANTLTSLGFDDGVSPSFYGKVKQLQVYDTALTDVQLTSLTS